MAETLNVQRREKLGGGNNRRLRRTGKVPAVLYGHGEASIPLAIESSAIMNVIRHGHKLVRLQGDAAFGTPDDRTAAAIERLGDLSRLEELLLRIRTAASWQELLSPPASGGRSGRRKA